MSLLILLIYLGSQSVFSAPTKTPPSLSGKTHSCSTHNQDSILGIIQECLPTLFACSWAAVHPNISPKGWHSTLIRAELMIWTILAPECTIYWAMRQWFGARNLEKIYRNKGWTKTHGYFLQMGGFVLADSESTDIKEVLSPKRLEALLRRKLIALPNVSEEDIQDRSKTDAIAKLGAVYNIVLFIVKFAIRSKQGHATTQLELGTLAFTVLSFILYYLWWNKPLDVQLPILVYMLDSMNAHNQNYTVASNAYRKPFGETEEEVREDDMMGDSSLVGSTYTPPISTAEEFNRPIGKKSTYSQLVSTIKAAVPNKSQQPSGPEACPKGNKFTFAQIFSNIKAAVHDRLQLFSGYEDDPAVPKMALPIFFSSQISDKDHVKLSTAAAVMGVIFGAVHFIGSDLLFPSKVERLIWQICSSVVLAYPAAQLILMLPAFMATHASTTDWGTDVEDVADEVWRRGSVLFMCLIPFYIIARLIIIGETFATLRALPLSAPSLAN